MYLDLHTCTFNHPLTTMSLTVCAGTKHGTCMLNRVPGCTPDWTPPVRVPSLHLTMTSCRDSTAIAGLGGGANDAHRCLFNHRACLEQAYACAKRRTGVVLQCGGSACLMFCMPVSLGQQPCTATGPLLLSPFATQVGPARSLLAIL